MALKILKVLWVFSLLATLTIFLYMYASLPASVVVNENTKPISLSKEVVFYIALALIAVSNALVFSVNRVYPEEAKEFRSWFYGLMLWVNLFFIIGLSYLSLYNSGEKYDYSRLGFIIYGSVAIMVMWIAAWPVYRMGQKIFRNNSA